MKARLAVAAAGMLLASALFGCEPKADSTKVTRSVFHVVAITPQGDDTASLSMGTAFVVAPGYLVTNNHVVENGQKFALFGSGLKDPVSVRVVARSAALDMALLASGTDLKRTPLVLDVTPPPVGSPVYAMGYPGASDKISGSDTRAEDANDTTGNLSRVVMGSWNGNYQFQMLQHSANLNHGNSGGPLLDACNRVIGVNTAGAPSQVNIGVDAQQHVTLEADVVSGVFQASGSTELYKYLGEQGIHVEKVDAACGAPPSATSIATWVVAAAVVLAAVIFGYILYRRRPKAAPPGRVGGMAVHDLPPRGLRLVGAGAGGGMTFDLVPQRFANTQGAVTLGRSPQLVDVVINSGHPSDSAADDTISRAHARILWKKDSFFVEDYGRGGEGSSNHTYVNGEQLAPSAPRPIRAGDRIRFGKHEFQVFEL